ncbi:hypothetical protein BGZ72_006202 [Mortierella alpina]|nr:hypothetical protein BGZ72_006202 [Mortierella alpina]
MRALSSPFDRDQFVLYNDPNCVSINREPASKTGYIFISYYFSKVPLSMRWTRIQPLLPVPTSTIPASTITPPTTATSSITLSVDTKITPSSTTSATATSIAIADIATPIRTTFPTALIPPNPMDSTAGWGDHSCDSSDASSDPSCQTNKHVNQILIAGITISIVVLVLMAAGTVYIYRTYYAPDHPTSSFMGSSAFRFGSNHAPDNTGHHSNSNSNHHNNNSSNNNNSGSGSSSGVHRPGTTDDDDTNPDYVYVHDESELDGGRQRFMFDHSRDNINTNKNPKLFKESSASPSSSRARYSGIALTFANGSENNASDINLLERNS